MYCNAWLYRCFHCSKKGTPTKCSHGLTSLPIGWMVVTEETTQELLGYICGECQEKYGT